MPGKDAHSDGVDADRIARMGGRRVRQRSVSSELAMRLRGFKGRTRARSTGGAVHHSLRQRVVVKAHVSRHKVGRAKGSLARHVSYLGRESASLDGQKGVFFDATRDEVSARREAAAWAEDRHHFRLIISPERGGDIPDMNAFVRQVMDKVQRDLGTKLTWVAVNHHNTDNPHAHILLRGKQADGSDLVIPRQYISYGIRDRAAEVATQLLGPRSTSEVELAKSREVQAERFTSLDRMIERHLESGKIDLSPSRHVGFHVHDRQLILGRLQFLQQLGLAHKGRRTIWHVEPDFKQTLRELGRRGDIVSQLYAQLGQEAGRVRPMQSGREFCPPVTGVAIAKGSVDEIGEDRFVVIRDADGQAHYGRVRESASYRDLQIGSLAELGAAVERRRKIAEQIVAVPGGHGGTYSAPQHEAYLRAANPGLTDRQIQRDVSSALARLRFVARAEGSGVRATGADLYAIDAEAFHKFSERGGARSDVRVIAEHPLPLQIEAHAVTWLDRQTFGERPDARTRHNPIVQEAIEQRGEWLVRHGYADRLANGQVVARPGAAAELRSQERRRQNERLVKEHGKSVIELPHNGTVNGKYVGTAHLHEDKLAVVVTKSRVYVSPVRTEPDIRNGSQVTVQRTSARDSKVELSRSRSEQVQAGATLWDLGR